MTTPTQPTTTGALTTLRNSIAALAIAATSIVATIKVMDGSTIVTSRCAVIVGNFETTQFNADSVYSYNGTGALVRDASVTVSTSASVPPQFVNRSVTVCIPTTTRVPTYRCRPAVEVFYSNEVTRGAMDTVLWVPPQGTALRDSLLKLDGGLPDVAPAFVSPVVDICFDSVTVGARPVLKS